MTFMFQDVSVQTATHGTLTARVAGKSGRVLLVLHGIGGNAECWSEQLEVFAQSHRVIAWNAPGYGSSSALRVPRPTLVDYADAVVALLTGLGINEPVDVLGHSMGGLIASMVAALHPQLVRRLVLADCSSGHRSYPAEERERILKARLALGKDADAIEYARSRVPNLLSRNPAAAHVEKAVEALSRLRQPGFGHATQVVSDSDIFEHASRIVAPTRVICGVEDRVTPEVLNRRIANAIGGADYVSIPAAGHWAFLEQPALFNRSVLDFLAA